MTCLKVEFSNQKLIWSATSEPMTYGGDVKWQQVLGIVFPSADEDKVKPIIACEEPL
jgi:hypothetical protein